MGEYTYRDRRNGGGIIYDIYNEHGERVFSTYGNAKEIVELLSQESIRLRSELATLQAALDAQSKALAEDRHIMRGILELLQSGAFTSEYKLLFIRKELEDYLAPSVAVATVEESENAE